VGAEKAFTNDGSAKAAVSSQLRIILNFHRNGRDRRKGSVFCFCFPMTRCTDNPMHRFSSRLINPISQSSTPTEILLKSIQCFQSLASEERANPSPYALWCAKPSLHHGTLSIRCLSAPVK